jgi:hypothetical protein
MPIVATSEKLITPFALASGTACTEALKNTYSGGNQHPAEGRVPGGW